MPDTYIVICLADTPEGQDVNAPHQRLAPMVLATRRVFADRATAEQYASTISYMRYPGVVAGDFHNLRLPQE